MLVRSLFLLLASWCALGEAAAPGNCPQPKNTAGEIKVDELMYTKWYLYQRATSGKSSTRTNDNHFCSILEVEPQNTTTAMYRSTTTFIRNGRKGHGINQNFNLTKDGRLESYDGAGRNYVTILYLQKPYFLLERCSESGNIHSNVFVQLYTTNPDEAKQPLSDKQRETFNEIIEKAALNSVSVLSFPSGLNDCDGY